MTIIYEADHTGILNADCRDAMRDMAAECADAIVTDPPYGLSFMGKDWDRGVPGVGFWTEALRVLKPGGHMLAFGGTRTYHRLACAIEDAGFDVRDCLMWLYGTGFPKSHNVSKAIDKSAGAKREVIGPKWAERYPNGPGGVGFHGGPGEYSQVGRPPEMETAPSTDEAKAWDGWGTALKPAWEPILVVRKPFKGTVAANVLAHGTGAINVDACRIETTDNLNGGAYAKDGTARHDGSENWRYKREGGAGDFVQPKGRWPANLIHDGTTGLTDDQQRFFYCAKPTKKEKGEGNTHPTVKPQKLMQWLVRLVTPPGGLLLDPFMGSGSTLVAAQAEGFDSIGIDESLEYCQIATKRLER